MGFLFPSVPISHRPPWRFDIDIDEVGSVGRPELKTAVVLTRCVEIAGVAAEDLLPRDLEAAANWPGLGLKAWNSGQSDKCRKLCKFHESNPLI